MTNSERKRDRPGDDVLGYSVAEIGLLRLAAEIVERQDGDGRLVRQGKSTAARH